MREPTLDGVPFSDCSNDELRDNILPPQRKVNAHDDCIPLPVAVNIAVSIAEHMIAERPET